MRVVLFAGSRDDELLRYIEAWVSSRHHDTVVVRAGHPRVSAWRRWSRKARRNGVRHAVLAATGLPVQRLLLGRDERLVRAALAREPRPDSRGREVPTLLPTANGDAAVRLLRELEPDVVIQAGAGILRERIFNLPRLGTINLHHGIAPLIRGVSSLHWALHARRHDWIGATIHRIDHGIDTGEVLAYAPVVPRPGERFPELFARVTVAGVAAMLAVLSRLESGERWAVAPSAGRGEYRSAIDGWRLLGLELRQRLHTVQSTRTS